MSRPRIAPVASQLPDGSGLIIAEQQQPAEAAASVWKAAAAADRRRLGKVGELMGGKAVVEERKQRRSHRGKVSQLFRRLSGETVTQSPHTSPKDILKLTEHKLVQLCFWKAYPKTCILILSNDDTLIIDL